MQFNPPQRHALAWGAIALLVGLVLWVLGPVLMPFVVAAVLAYALNPVVRGLERVGKHFIPSFVAVLLVEIGFLVVVVAVFTLLVPIVVTELPQMRDKLPALLERGQTFLAPWLASMGVQVSLEPENIKAFVLQNVDLSMGDGVAKALASLRIGGSVVLALVGNLVLIPVVLFYLLVDWRHVTRHMHSLVPMKMRPAFDSFIDESDQVLGQYLRGQLSVMVAMAVFYSLGLWWFGLELALPIGVFTGLAVFVPYVGFGLGLVLASIAALLQFPFEQACLMLIVVFGLGQALEGFVLTPRLVGERIGLHPLHVIFALLAFGQLFGFVGVLIALPASAVLLVAIRRLRHRYQSSELFRA
jgi:predicted PurR-regulated permease PerM